MLFIMFIEILCKYIPADLNGSFSVNGIPKLEKKAVPTIRHTMNAFLGPHPDRTLELEECQRRSFEI